MSKKKALLMLNGSFNLSSKEIKKIINDKQVNTIIAVDGGANIMRRLELLPDLIIGDLDSLTDINKKFFIEKDINILKYPVEKDQTDSEIAVDYCSEHKFDKLYITGALGGRIDQQLANLNLLEYIYELNLEAEIISNNINISLINKYKKFTAKKGYRLSLIPQSQNIHNLTIKGCKYNLKDQDINRSQSRGISNLIEEDWAEIKFESGLLIYILEKI